MVDQPLCPRKYQHGQRVSIKSGIYEGHTFLVDEIELTQGPDPLLRYRYDRHRRWYYEEELQTVEESEEE